MLTKKLEKAFNEQINKELFSAYLYLSMSAWAEGESWRGAKHWFAEQAKEEMAHAMKFYAYLFERGNKATLDAIEKPKADFKGLADLFSQALKHEKFVTQSIHKLVDMAAADKDHASSIFLQWFVTEQVEEEANAAEMLLHLERVGDSKQGQYMLDNVLSKRSAG